MHFHICTSLQERSSSPAVTDWIGGKMIRLSSPMPQISDYPPSRFFVELPV